jgi:nitroreductase
MEFLDLVKKRRSCRSYSAKPVLREKIERCLEAARLAPSACNSQPWRFISVVDTRLKESLAQHAFAGLYAMNRFAKEAPVLIVVIRERSKYAARLGGTLRGLDYSLIDLGIAVEHLVLQAAELGLGTCWLGWFDERAVKRVLGLERSFKIDVIISLGYPQEIPESAQDRKPAAQTWEFR